MIKQKVLGVSMMVNCMVGGGWGDMYRRPPGKSFKRRRKMVSSKDFEIYLPLEVHGTPRLASTFKRFPERGLRYMLPPPHHRPKGNVLKCLRTTTIA